MGQHGLASDMLLMLMMLPSGLTLHGLLVKWVSFLSYSCTGLLLVGLILGLVVFLLLELLILYELWAGERLVLEKKLASSVSSGLGVQFQCRLFLLVQALIFGALAVLLVHMMTFSLSCCQVVWSSFVPCSTGANHCRLEAPIGWEKCAVMGSLLVLVKVLLLPFLDQLLSLFQVSFWVWSGALLAGTLPLTVLFYSSFAC